MTKTQIKTEMEKLRKQCDEKKQWLHKNKRYVALLNEYGRRAGFNWK